MTKLYFADTSLPGRIAVAPCPPAAPELDGVMQLWRAEGIQLVVSLLETGEADDLGVAGEDGACRAHGIEFLSVPVPDHWIPDDAGAFDAGVGLATGRLLAGKGVVAHCMAGIGRSPMFAACVLVRSGFDAATACRLLSEARRFPVPEMEEQRRWVDAYEASLVRSGRQR